MKSLLLLFFLTVQTFGLETVRYDNHQVLRVVPKTRDELKLLNQLHHNFDFWTGIKGIGHNVDIMVPPSKMGEFKSITQNLGLTFETIITDVQKLIDNERSRTGVKADFDWTDYHTLEEINAWLSSLAETYPDQVSLIEGGTTYENRTILGVHVSYGAGNENRTVFIEANIHAREWISSATATFILNELLTSTDENVRRLAESHDWYFFPIINPDGFAYTHATDRMWRKTRVPYDNDCYGADPNRNWGYHWNEGGTSNDPCSNEYRGPEPFSEPATKSLSEFITTVGPSLQAYIAFHSYSQLMLIPYGYSDEHLDNYDELYSAGLKAADSLSKRYGTKYTVGNIVETLYIASGNSPDWVKGTFGTRVTYTYELRDTGTYGFILPADQIIPTAEETLDSLVTLFEQFED